MLPPYRPTWLLSRRSVAWAMITLAVAGCRLSQRETEAAQDAAEHSYGGALLKCVDDAQTLAESKACRARVDREWGVTSTVRDAGGER
jgi:hypothetical protein